MSFIRQQALAATSSFLANLAPSLPAPGDIELLDRAIAISERVKPQKMTSPPTDTPQERAARMEFFGENQSRVIDCGKSLVVLHLRGELDYTFPLAEWLDAIGRADTVSIYIDCPGGCIKTALSIFRALSGKPTEITVMGRCYSAAIIILCAGQKRRIVSDGRLLVHSPTGACIGTPEQLRECADYIESTRETMAAILCRHCPADLVATWLTSGKVIFSPAEALAVGLVNEVIEVEPTPTPK